MKEFIEAIKKGRIEEIETFLNNNRFGDLSTIISLAKHRITCGRLVKKNQYILDRRGLGGIMTSITLPKDDIILVYITRWLSSIIYKETRYSIRLLYSDSIPENADNNIIFRIIIKNNQYIGT